jgi:CGNR zinc finger/Putative stress-induced transcription regulator
VNFNSHTDRVVAQAAEFVNLLTPGERHGRPYQPPAAQDQLDTLPGYTGSTEAEAAEFTALAGRLRLVFAAVTAGDIDDAARRVNEMLDETGARPVLARHDGEPWHVHFHAVGGGRSAADEWGASCATGLAIVLGGELHDRLGVCTAPHCDRVYVDVSRNGSRRFCSTACQNRVKAAAFRERRG